MKNVVEIIEQGNADLQITVKKYNSHWLHVKQGKDIIAVNKSNAAALIAALTNILNEK